MVFPKPQSEQYTEQTFRWNGPEADRPLTEWYRLLKDGTEALTVRTDAALAPEAYVLQLAAEGVSVEAAGPEGVFRALTSLRQLVRKTGGLLPCGVVRDAPDFQNRAYLLDISCGRKPAMPFLRQLIDRLAELKYNEFQLYLEGRCFCYEKLPEYDPEGGALTGAEIEELDRYCRERFIELVPNQNSFGHMGEWLEQEEFRPLRVGTDEVNTGTLNIQLEKAFEFVDRLYESLLPHFSSERVNIGLDEAYGLGLYQLEELCREKGRDTVFTDWLNRLADHIREKYGKSVQFWADMLYRSPSAYTAVPADATALAWGYETIKTTLMEKICFDLQQKGVPYYVCGGADHWTCLTGRLDDMHFNLRGLGEFGLKYGACGYMVTDWGLDDGHTQFPVWSLPAMAVGAQYAWTVGVEQNGGQHKYGNVRAALRYLDEFVFGAPVADWLCRLSRYYLLEPERFHSGTFCCTSLLFPLTETAYRCFYDLKDSGDVFCLENTLEYLQQCIRGVEAVDFDENAKRQVLLGAEMSVLGGMLCLARIVPGYAAEHYEELCARMDAVREEYALLWDRENYPGGKEIFLDKLACRRQELDTLVHREV